MPHLLLLLMNRLSKIESGIFVSCDLDLLFEFYLRGHLLLE